MALAAQEAPPTAAPQPPPVAAAPPAEAPAPRTELILLETPLGPIRIAVEVERAPVTALNFLRYVRERRLDGATFYRALKLTPDGSHGLVQGGLRGNPGKSLAPIAHEPTSRTGLAHVEGAVSMARAAPGTAQADFFIVLGTLASLDAAEGGDPGYAVFGRVVEGMEVVRAILEAPVDPAAGEGAMKGQLLRAPVPILRATHTPR